MPASPAVRLRYHVDLRYEVAVAGADFIFNVLRTPQRISQALSTDNG
jgi:hypothetical protein